MHQPADVLHFGTPRTPLLRNNPPHGGVRHQPHDPRPGPRRRLVRGAVGARLRQIPRNGAHAREGLAGHGADRRRGAREHRVPRAAGDAPRFARYVSGRGGRRAGRCRLYRPCYGRFCLERACPIVYSHGEYFALGEAIGHFGWSVRRKPRRTAGAAPQSPHLLRGISRLRKFRSTRADPGTGSPPQNVSLRENP